MGQTNKLPSINEIIEGNAVFRPDMPVWLGFFGQDLWPFLAPTSPLYEGACTGSFVWRDYMEGRGASLGHPSSFFKAKYEYCLTPEIVSDLKVAAVIHGFFPKLIKDSRSHKEQLDPKTVKGRIDELAKLFSLAIIRSRMKWGKSISSLSQISFSLLQEVIAEYPGRQESLKRALKLISDPMVQKNISSPLQWRLLDVTKSSILWSSSENYGGIDTLPDSHFLFLLDYCKRAIAKFKWLQGIKIHDSDCRDYAPTSSEESRQKLFMAFDGYYREKTESSPPSQFHEKYDVTATDIATTIRDAHSSALLLVLLFTGMRASELVFLSNNCLIYENGYWFLKSKVVKNRPKDMPLSEGWLAIDLTRDAYDVLSFFCSLTKSPFLFSSPFPGFVRKNKGYHKGSLNIKFKRWFESIDVDGLLAGWKFSIHQCRETLVFQLAKQEVGLPFISMQLKHFHSQFKYMPNTVTASYGQYREQLMTSISNRIAEARETALLDVYGENAKFAGGGGVVHKSRIDAFFSGLGLFGKKREQYIKAMAKRGVKLMPTSIGSCTRNFVAPTTDRPPPCFGDYQCDPNCQSHVITEGCANALVARRKHALSEAEKEANPDYKVIWIGLAQKLESHINKFVTGTNHV